MKALPKLDLNANVLTRMLTAAIPASVLLTGIELDVFSHLGKPRSAASLGEVIGSHHENTTVLLDTLAANGLVHKKNGLYWNCELSQVFLVKGKPTFLGDVLLDSAEWVLSDLSKLTELVKHGPPAGGRSPHSIPWEKEVEIRANYQRAGQAQRCAAMISQLPEFPGMRRVLDLGSGAGLIGLAIVGAHESMVGVLFDKPTVVEVAKRFIREYEMGDRVSTMAGDYTVDPIGDNYDLIWTSYTLSPGSMDSVIQKIHDSLNPGGVHVNLGEGLTNERTQPKEMVNSMLANNLNGCHRMHEQGAVAHAMLRAGFKSVHTMSNAAGEFGTGTIDVARK